MNLNTPRYITLYIICKPTYACKQLCKTYGSLNLTLIVNKYVKLVIKFINLTWILELKIYISWNNTLFDYSFRVIYLGLSNRTDLSFLVRQIPENTDRVVSSLILTKVLLSDLEFVIELYLVNRYLRIQIEFIRSYID